MTVLLIVDLVMSAGILLGGYYLRFHTGDAPEGGVGIRTAAAMKSPEAWRYANRTCGRCWMIAGLCALLLTVSVMLFLPETWSRGLRTAVSILPAVILVIAVWSVLFRVQMRCMQMEDERHAGQSTEETP